MSNENNEVKPSRVEVLNAAFAASGITFKDNGAALESFQQQHAITYDEETGAATTFVDGVRTPLHKALADFGLSTPDLIDGRSLPRVRAKDELKDVQAKSLFIKIHGINAFTALPMSYQEPGKVETWSEWRKLTTAQKSELIKVDPSIQARLKQDEVTTHPFGAKINNAKLAEIAELRRKSGRSAR